MALMTAVAMMSHDASQKNTKKQKMNQENFICRIWLFSDQSFQESYSSHEHTKLNSG